MVGDILSKHIFLATLYFTSRVGLSGVLRYLTWIPRNIPTVYTPARDDSLAPMTVCCAPHAVQVAEGCYYWCELPQTFIDGNSWSFCLSNTNTPGAGNQTAVSGIHIAAGVRSFDMGLERGKGKAVLWMVAVGALMCVGSW